MIITNSITALIDDFLNLALVKELFNVGKFTIDDADWFLRVGYNVICANGKVEYIERIEI